ncbi:hypothetical protein, partial [Microbacterium aurantiacum]|uniref:hypothetical protein n=1 Tax=Microbacterium aurantiacum TaxID=162393 RepID=UPI003439A185
MTPAPHRLGSTRSAEPHSHDRTPPRGQPWGSARLAGCRGLGAQRSACIRSLAHTFHDKAELFGISGDVHFDFGVAWDR